MVNENNLDLIDRYVKAFNIAIESSNPRENTNVLYDLMCNEISVEFADRVVSICIP